MSGDRSERVSLTPFGGERRVLGEWTVTGVTGLLAPEGDAAAFAEQLVALADPDRWKSMSSAGVERTRRVFSREVMAGELATLLEQIRAGRFATPAARRTAPRSRLGWRAHVPPALRRYTKRLPF